MRSTSKILLAVGGGIAAYKSAILCSRLVQSGHDVRVAMTDAATQFIGTATLAALSGEPVIRSPFDASMPAGAHIAAVDDIALMIIAPATANLIADLATGCAADVVTTCYLQNVAPVLIAPAMSAPMWDKPAVQRNIKQLRDDGCHLVGPESGWLACRKKGFGRMSQPEQIIEAAAGILATD